MKDIITFNKYKELKAKPNEFPLKVLEEKLILDCLSKGYLPKGIKSGYYQGLSPYYIEPIEFDYANCVCAYVGKKQAPVLWKNNNKILL